MAKSKKIKPDDYQILNIWGLYLGYYAKTKSGEEQKELYKEAIKKLKNAIEIKSDYNPVFYNMACIYALQNKPNESIEQLKKAISLNKDEYTKVKIFEDKDFDEIKDSSEFKAFLDETF